jgi:hypothetical protein
LGGSNYENNIWTRGFAIAFVFAVSVFETQIRSPGENSGFCYVFRVFDPPTRAPYQVILIPVVQSLKHLVGQFSGVDYPLVWATKLPLAAIGLIFQALVLGYNFFIVKSMTNQFLYRMKNLCDYCWQQ